MELYTERLTLRPWREDDAEHLYAYAKDPRVGPVTGWPPHTSVEESRQIIGSVLSVPETYAVCLKGREDAPIGSVGIIRPARTEAAGENDAEIGCWLGVPHWGNGYMPEAIDRLQQYAFDELGIAALWYGWYDGNTKSQRCGQKCGFTYHHTLHDRPVPLLGDDVRRTEHFARLTEPKWRERCHATLCGADCSACFMSRSCRGCARTNGRPFGGSCVTACALRAGGSESLEALKRQLIAEFNGLGIEDMPEVTELHGLCGMLANLPVRLPNGETVKLLSDREVYLGTQLEKNTADPEHRRCYGLAAGTDFLLVLEYGERGADPELVRLQRRRV